MLRDGKFQLVICEWMCGEIANMMFWLISLSRSSRLDLNIAIRDGEKGGTWEKMIFCNSKKVLLPRKGSLGTAEVNRMGSK